MATCYALALPLGELSPQVTERGTKKCGASPDRCYGGIAAEIDTKNMPPAYFLNVSTLSVLVALGHLSQRERRGMPRHEICLTNQMKKEQAQQIFLLCLFTVSCSPLIEMASFRYRVILPSAEWASVSSGAQRSRKRATCCGQRPMYRCGSIRASSS